MTDEPHGPARGSWGEQADREGCDSPIQNLPLGVFRAPGEGRARLGVAIGDFILDAGEWLAGETLNGYLALPATQRGDLRREWSQALAAGEVRRLLYPQADCAMLLPAVV